jgi:hypothetical protein
MTSSIFVGNFFIENGSRNPSHFEIVRRLIIAPVNSKLNKWNLIGKLQF